MSPTISLLIQGSWETLYMISVAGLFAILFGLPLGILVFTTKPYGITPSTLLHKPLNLIIDIVRSVPFIILLISLVPFTRLLVGTTIGTTAAIVPLCIGAIPFFARIVESALTDLPTGLIETGQALGATPRQMITKMLLPEALPAVIRGSTLMLIALVGYSAMAGAVGGGGLGAVAINYGYQRFDVAIMFATVVILIILVHIIQFIGERIANRFTH